MIDQLLKFCSSSFLVHYGTNGFAIQQYREFQNVLRFREIPIVADQLLKFCSSNFVVNWSLLLLRPHQKILDDSSRSAAHRNTFSHQISRAGLHVTNATDKGLQCDAATARKVGEGLPVAVYTLVYVYTQPLIYIQPCARVFSVVYNIPPFPSRPASPFSLTTSPAVLLLALSPIHPADIPARRSPVYPSDVAGCYIIVGRCCQICLYSGVARSGRCTMSACWLACLFQRASRQSSAAAHE